MDKHGVGRMCKGLAILVPPHLCKQIIRSTGTLVRLPCYVNGERTWKPSTILKSLPGSPKLTANQIWGNCSAQCLHFFNKSQLTWSFAKTTGHSKSIRMHGLCSILVRVRQINWGKQWWVSGLLWVGGQLMYKTRDQNYKVHTITTGKGRS